MAEVRVLQIGNRQVTLSVFKQLDWVTPIWIEPFGRVSDGSDHWDVVRVVGRHRETGVLVRSEAVRYWKNTVANQNPFYFDWRQLPLIVLAGLR
jgi:hypothetical protein